MVYYQHNLNHILHLIPPLKMRNNFIYLGNSFSFDMNVDIQAGLVTDMNKYFDILN